MPRAQRAHIPGADPYVNFMARAYAMELEATDRYAGFAEQLEAHNNIEVAQLFRKLSDIEALHARRILSESGRSSMPALAPVSGWDDPEGPETAPFDSLHYLMQPYHALEIALRCELKAQKYFEDIAAGAVSPRVRAAAAEMAAEEREHAQLIRDWMSRVPRPEAGWDHDPDPPRTSE